MVAFSLDKEAQREGHLCPKCVATFEVFMAGERSEEVAVFRQAIHQGNAA